MSSSDEDMKGGASPMVSDSESDGGKPQTKKQDGKKRRLSKDHSKKSKKSKKSKVIDDSDEDEKRPKSSFIEDEASESDDGDGVGSDDDDSDDEGEDKNEYEADGFVVDDEDDEGSDGGGGGHRRRRRKKEKKLRRLKQKINEVDDEDLMLVRENLGMDTGPTHSDSEDEYMGRSSKKRKDQDAGLMSRELSRRMFGDSDDEEEDPAPARNNNNYLGNDEYESDDLEDFIDDDDEGEGREGPRRRRKQVALPASMQGPSLYQMGEAEELFGDMEGFLEATRGALPGEAQAAPRSKKAALLEKYEPDVLKEHMMTPEIISVRDKDLPERYQQVFQGRQFPDAEDRAEESEWISHFILKNQDDKRVSPGEIVSAIDSVLRFYHDEKLEPAFVQRYCKEFWKPAGLHSSDLYEILDLDVKWDKLKRKEKSFDSGIDNAVDSASAKESRFVRDCYREILRVPEEKCYQDMAEFFALDASDSQDQSSQDRKFRRPARRNFYQICTKGGLRPVSNAFTMNATVLGGILVGLDHDPSLRDVPTPEESPGTFGQKYTSKEFPMVDDVMRGARHIAATRIAAEPNVRKCLREFYRQHASIYTEATVKGQEEIDEFHYCYGLQYLEGMPVFEALSQKDYWSRLLRAEKEGLVTVAIVNNNLQELIEQLQQVFGDNSNESDEEWENQRYQVLQEAVSSFMIPSFENELRRDLMVASREYLVKQCGSIMRQRLSVRPFETKDSLDPFIISIWVDSGPEPIMHMVALDDNGELADKTQAYCRRDEKHIRNLTTLLYRFLKEHSKTDVVVINVSGGNKCLDMGELVDVVRHELGRDNAARFGNHDGKDWMEITFLKDDVASMYSRSKRAELEFPEESESVRAAIGLARYLRNPVSELSAMWGNHTLDDPQRGRELLYLNVHEMQHSLVKEMLIREYDRVFARVINKYGVDINLLANHKHASYQLQFISGLGPVKSTALLDKIRAKTVIERRQELLSKGMVGKIVYRNCAGFLRIRERDALKEAPLNPLDDTRIHPESYYMAVKMCGDANNNSTIDMYDPNQYSYAVEDTMFQSATAIKNKARDRLTRLTDAEIQDALSELDLPAYASRLELQKKGPKLLTLEYIKRELRYPYFDKRRPYEMPNEEELFILLSGETMATFRRGMIVPCTLLHMAGNEFVRVRLHNGMRASLKKSLLPDYINDEAFIKAHGFPKGITVNARVLQLRKDPNGRYEVELGCNNYSVFNGWIEDSRPPSGAALNRIQEDRSLRLEKLINRLAIDDDKDLYVGERRAGPPKRKKRQIGHPAFKNVNCQSAMQYLREQAVGEVVIRPSTIGSDHLTLTWKMLDGVYRHFDILERNKPSEARLGEQLVIKEEVFSGIDELIARYVDPMNALVDEVINYKYFKLASLEEVHEDLIKQKKAHPARIPYILHLYTKFPGCFSISFIARSTPHSCHMEVKPNGFRFFGRIESSILPTLSQALQFFKMKALVAPSSSSSRPSQSSSSRGESSGNGSAPFAQRPPPQASSYHRDAPSSGGDRYRQDSRFDDRRNGGGFAPRPNDYDRYNDNRYPDSRHQDSRFQDSRRGDEYRQRY